MFRRAEDLDLTVADRAAFFRYGNGFAAGKIIGGDGSLFAHELFRCSAGHNFAAVDPRRGADVDDIV